MAENASFCEQTSCRQCRRSNDRLDKYGYWFKFANTDEGFGMHKWIDSGELAEVVMRKSAHTAVEELGEIMTPKSKGITRMTCY